MIKTLEIAEFTPSADKVIWDVRDHSAYNQGHIAHAVNMPVDSLTAEQLAGVQGDVYVLCGGGTKAGRATQKLHEFDPSRTIIHLTGGTRQAKALGWEIISEPNS